MNTTATAPTTDNYDPFKEAQEAKPLPRVVFGLLEVDMWACVLQAGVGKALFDPQQHTINQRHTAISLSIHPYTGSRSQYSTKRDMIVRSNDWTGIVRPSIDKLGTDIRSINGKYVQAELVESGTNKKTGKPLTQFSFVAVYKSEAECIAAAEALYGHGESQPVPGSENPPAEIDFHDAARAAAPPQLDDPQREAIAKFLPILWETVQHNTPAFLAEINRQATFAKYFNESSPEVVKIIGDQSF